MLDKVGNGVEISGEIKIMRTPRVSIASQVTQLAALAAVVLALPVVAQNPKPAPGLAVTFTSGGITDATITPNLWLYRPEGLAITPFLPAGKFTAVWDGAIVAELRGDFTFRAILNSALKVEVNGATVLDVTGQDNQPTAPSATIRLNKGPNVLKATYTSPASGSPLVRLEWSENKGILWEPIALGQLTHAASAATSQGEQLRLGRELLIENRCLKCHVSPAATLPDLALDAPSFEDIGARRQAAWIAQWILDPHANRALANMPALLHGPAAKDDAIAIAAYLTSLKPADAKPGAHPGDDLAAAGQKLFESLHCVACHIPPGDSAADPKKISLKHVAQKFVPGTLTEFLKKPDQHYAWIRMPNFKLDDAQRSQLAAFILSKADKSGDSAASTDKAILDRGQKLVQTSGCLNCHGGLKIENQFATKSLADLKDWKAGCLAEKPGDGAKAPVFAFNADERAAILAFAATDRSALARHVPQEFSEREIRHLNCLNCHGQVEGVPHLEILGGKLKPEWATKFIAGEITYKPRTWLEMQMPAFPKRAALLAEGMTMQHGLSPTSTPEPAIDEPLAAIGQKLTGTDGGLSCLSCHGIAKIMPTQVFEAPGINLAYSADRLQPAYFHRWLRNPIRVDSASKMPVFFDDEGKSPLGDILEGSADKQIDALWNYIRKGDKMPPPPGAPEPQP